MTRLIRNEGMSEAIWVLLQGDVPEQCPECKMSHSFDYIGFADRYSNGLHGKIYQCRECNSWLDCVWPSQTPAEDNSNNIHGAAAV